MLLIGHGSKDILTKAAKSIKLPVGKTISEMVQESHFPDYKQLIPTPETRTAELRVVGVRYNRAGSGFQTILTDGENVIAVNADKLAWLRKRLPDAKIYGSTAYRQDELNSCAPITFVENGEAVGVLMPMFIGEDKAETWTNLPDVIKQAVRRDEKKSGRTQSVAPSIMSTSKSVAGFVADINKQPYVPLEGEKTFNVKALPEVEALLGKYASLDDFLKDASLADKLSVSKYLNTGEWEYPPLNLANVDDMTARTWSDVLLRPYVGLDTRGLVKVSVGLGAHIDLFAVEKKIDNTLRRSYLDSGYQGSKTKSGRVWQKLQDVFSKHTSSTAELQAIHDARTDRAKAADERLQHSVVIEPDDPRADVWKRDPGRMDVRGVDTPRKSKARKRKTSHRSSPSGGMQSLK